MSNIHQDSNYKRVSTAIKQTLGKLSEENVATFDEETEESHPSRPQDISTSTHSVPLDLDPKPIRSVLKKSNEELYVDKSLLRTYSHKDLASFSLPITTKTKALRFPIETVPSSCRTSLSESTHSSASSIKTEKAKEQTKMKRNISFSTLEVRQYDLTLGDNPGCSEGPPVSLDWKYEQSDVLDIEEYESIRHPRRCKGDLRLDHNTRYFALSSQFTSSDLRRATDAAKQIRIQRKKSISNKKLDPLHAVLESTERKVKRLLGKSKKINN